MLPYWKVQGQVVWSLIELTLAYRKILIAIYLQLKEGLAQNCGPMRL